MFRSIYILHNFPENHGIYRLQIFFAYFLGPLGGNRKSGNIVKKKEKKIFEIT